MATGGAVYSSVSGTVDRDRHVVIDFSNAVTTNFVPIFPPFPAGATYGVSITPSAAAKDPTVTVKTANPSDRFNGHPVAPLPFFTWEVQKCL